MSVKMFYHIAVIFLCKQTGAQKIMQHTCTLINKILDIVTVKLGLAQLKLGPGA